MVYASTTGVYGDCGGALIDETRAVRPANPRALRRVSAERQLRRATARGAVPASIARIPGIYAGNRLPLARLEKGTPALIDADDVYTNHIHADDLAAILVRMMRLGGAARVVHASDDTTLKMGEYFDVVADAYGLERPPRITRAAGRGADGADDDVVHARIAAARERADEARIAGASALSDRGGFSAQRAG